MSARARDAVLSERALALRPAVLSSSSLGARATREDPWAEIAFESAALAPREESLLARIALDANTTRGRLRCSLRELESLSSSSPSAALLFAACENERAPASEPRTMGVLNVTPDSFSDGGLYDDPRRAVERALEMEREGADILDVGGESTRPGSEGVSAEVELARVLPVIEALASEVRVPISIDTTKASVAERALELGASIVNDVSAGRFDPRMLALVAERGCTFVLMHMLGSPRDMQLAPRYEDVVLDVLEFLRQRAHACLAAGIRPERLWIDPGIGFGKTLEHNLELIARLQSLRSLGLPVCVGVSRKSFIAKLGERTGVERGAAPSERAGGTAAAVAACVLAGADVLRVHDVRVMSEAARVAWALSRVDGSAK